MMKNRIEMNNVITVLSIQKLIEKYEGKINSAENLKHKGTGYYADVPTKEEKERLDVRIYERKTFVEDLKEILKNNKYE